MIPSEMRVFEAAMSAMDRGDGLHEFGHGPIVKDKKTVGEGPRRLSVYRCRHCGVCVRRESPEEFREYDCEEMANTEHVSVRVEDMVENK